MDEKPLTKQDIEKMIQDGIQSFMNTKQFNLSKIQSHSHNGLDSVFVNDINLPTGTMMSVGLGGMASTSNAPTFAPGSVGEQIQTTVACGKNISGKVFDTNGDNLQLNLLHQPQNASNQSFITGWRPPLYTTAVGTTISITAGGSTVLATGHNFAVNGLAGALINIYDSTGSVFYESKIIASNTAETITITGTWVNNVTGGKYFILQPVFFGSAEAPWQRLYTSEGTGGGVRFGVGPTAGGQNGMLYMDATGNIYWRNKSGTAVQLNSGGGSYSVTTSTSLGAGFILTRVTPVHIVGGTAARTSDGTTPIAAGTAGDVLILVGTSDTETITIQSSGNVDLDGGANCVLGATDTLSLIYAGGLWLETSRSNN